MNSKIPSQLSFQHLLDVNQIQESDIELLISKAEEFRKQGHQKTFQQKPCEGLILSTLFFEPSTRTRFSFESAFVRLGGQILTLEYGESSSVKKGETLADTGRIMSSYADIITIRHPQIGSAVELAKHATVPVINAGDGANQHPSQALVDLYTIFCEKGKLDGLKIGIVGDLKYSRTVHSFLGLMGRYSNNSFTLVSHPSLALEKKEKSALEKRNCKIIETSDLQQSLQNLDILYVTRVQQERFIDASEYEKVKNSYQITKETLAQAAKNLTIMHPLPRINEIDSSVDELPQARYFAQANYGVHIRMALLALMTNSQN